MLINLKKVFFRAKAVLIAAIICTVLPWIIPTFCVFFLDEKYYGFMAIAVLLSFFTAIALWMINEYISAPQRKNAKLLDALGHSYDYWFEGAEQGYLLRKSNIICADHALLFKKQKLVIPYSSILWIYKRVEKNVLQVTLSKSIIIGTTTGEKIAVGNIMDDELSLIVRQHSYQFAPGYMLGLTVETEKKFKNYRKQLRFKHK